MGKLSVVAVLVVCMELCALLNAHSHDEPAHFKYSKEVNEQAAWEQDHHEHSHDEHGHTHDAGDRHEHVHDVHAHSHGGEYAPDADHGHGHTHGAGGCQHAHNQEVHSEHKHDHGDGHSHEETVTKSGFLKDNQKYDPEGYLSFMNDPYTRLWVHSIGSTLLISFAPFVILSVIPIQANTAENEPLLKVLLSFGSGGLLGDAFLHLIPHAQPAAEPHSHSHSHGDGHSHGPHDMSVGGWVLAGIIAFLTVEKLVRIFRAEGHSHSHSHGHSHKETSKEGTTKNKKKTAKAKSSDVSSADESDECDKKAKEESSHQTGFKVAAYLNMAADFAHNFTDGLAIGASFLAGTTVGVVTMITVLVHEVPHEIGDFAILVQSGFSKRKAMMVQLLTALGALSGCALSLLTANVADVSDSAAAASWVLPFTAGGFIYIATVSVIPELLENSSAWQSVKEIIALLTGIFLMYLIAFYE